MQFTNPTVLRVNYIWDDAFPWLVNAEKEDLRVPFHVIFARDNPSGNARVITANGVASGQATSWAAPNSTPVERTADALANCFAPMLRCAKKIIIVDPYFRATKPEFNRSLAAFMKFMVGRGLQITVELHTADRDDAPPFSSFKTECERYLPKLIPTGISVCVRRWKQRPGGEGLHNRFILTDIGGVFLGWGTAEGDTGRTDDIARLSAEHCRIRLEQYQGPKFAFDVDGEFDVGGTAP
jgi:hypothetical protein